ncbi:IclR family transcriptional regulator [Nocardioides daejeonensis]|uniref:IclR family transcriptional regulator n=1 Tax=Nocardioides daejeonensis TaxID=1046556 RepID=UPI001950477B|nr:IclR family transcriptional regulator [Nocardioides daejeonensis]
MTLTASRRPESGAPLAPTPSPSMIERMTAVLDAFDAPTTRCSLDEVIARTGLARSTAHRILTALTHLSWIERTADGYALGPRALAFADWENTSMDLRHAAAPVLHELQVATGMVVHLGVLKGAHVHVLDKLGGRFAASVPTRVGGRVPAHGTALGKAILAWLPAEQIDEVVGGQMGRMTSRTIIDLNVLHDELRRVRERRGLAFEQGECFPTVNCVSSAVMGEAGPVGSISLAMPPRTPLEKVAPLVADATRRVSAELNPRRTTVPTAESHPLHTWSREALDTILLTSSGRWM